MAQGSLIVHVVMIAIVGAISFLYIYPTIQSIRDNQDTAQVFKNEINRVSVVNASLKQKVDQINSIPLQDRSRLMSYMPDAIDELAVMKMMEAILISSGIIPASLEIADAGGSQTNSTIENIDSKVIETVISTSFEAREDVIYAYFDAISQSMYPFVINEAEFTPKENNLIQVDLSLSVFALAPRQVGVESSDLDDVIY